MVLYYASKQLVQLLKELHQPACAIFLRGKLVGKHVTEKIFLLYTVLQKEGRQRITAVDTSYKSQFNQSVDVFNLPLLRGYPSITLTFLAVISNANSFHLKRLGREGSRYEIQIYLLLISDIV